MRRSRSCFKRWSGESGSRPWMSVPAGPTSTTFAPERQDGRFLPRLPLVRARGRGRRRGSARLQKLLPRAAALIVDNGSVMCMAGYPGVAPRAVFFPLDVKPGVKGVVDVLAGRVEELFAVVKGVGDLLAVRGAGC